MNILISIALVSWASAVVPIIIGGIVFLIGSVR